MTQDEIIPLPPYLNAAYEGDDLFSGRQLIAAVLAEREACAKVCEKQIKIFLSPQYATGQPLSSFRERHAVASCVEAIRARGEQA